MRISDWSSDVCSSDLIGPCPRRVPRHYRRRASRVAARRKKASLPLRANARDREAGNAGAASPPRPATPDRAILALVRFDIVDRVLDGGDLFRRIVGDFDAEFFFERHHQFDDVEAVGAQIVDEARFLGNLVGFDAQMFDDDLFNLFGRIAHAQFLFSDYVVNVENCPSARGRYWQEGWPRPVPLPQRYRPNASDRKSTRLNSSH